MRPPPPKPPKPPPPPPRPPPPPPSLLTTGVPGLLYESCCRRSQSLRGSAPASRIQVRLRREVRSDSESSAIPFSVYDSPPNRHSVLVTSVGVPENGAASASTLSRKGALFFGFPPSSASTHVTVAG